MMSSRSLSRIILVLFASSLSLSSVVQARSGQDSGPKIIRKAGGVLQGEATYRVAPAYPPLAKAARISGTVIVEVLIDVTGNVESARALSGHPLLKDAAVNAARQWTFAPTSLSGTPVKVVGTISFAFQAEDSDERSKGEKRIEAARQAVEADPYSAQTHFDLGEAYYDNDRLEEAIKAYEQALQLKPDYLGAYREIAEAYKQTKRFDEAIRIYKKALEYFPRSIEMLDRLAWAYVKLGKMEEAERYLTEAVLIDDSSATLHEHLGDLYQMQGKFEQARSEWQKALSLTDQADQITRLKTKIKGRAQK
jgi:TonB family protein